MATYVCSDIHGQYGLFKKLLKTINFTDEDTMYILGDIIDRGDESIPLLLDIMERKNVYCLLGNHEHMMYTFLKKKTFSPWTNPANGGDITYEQYLKLPDKQKEDILNYIEEMYLQIQVLLGENNFFLSHSSFTNNCETQKWKNLSPAQVETVVWYSPWRFWEYRPKNEYRKTGFIHIIGHIPVQYIEENQHKDRAYIDYVNNIIDIDLGCASIDSEWETGAEALCCLRLDNFIYGENEEFIYIRKDESDVE